VNQIGLFEAQITVLESNSNWISSFHKIQQILQRPATYALLLLGFYVIPRQHQLLLTRDEQHFLKGLGKKSLCLGIDHIITILNMEASKTVLLLEASGGAIVSEADEIAFHNYMMSSYEDLLEIYKKRYYEDYLLYPPDHEKDDLATLLVTTNNNKKLIAYYKSAFGFISLNNLTDGKHMGVFVDTLLNHC
jgi:hypothetical protein